MISLKHFISKAALSQEWGGKRNLSKILSCDCKSTQDCKFVRENQRMILRKTKHVYEGNANPTQVSKG